MNPAPIAMEQMTGEHRTPVIDIFNHYIQTSFSAYPEQCVPSEFFDLFLKMTAGYPAYVAKAGDGTVVGFGMLRAWHPMPTFSRTAEISYFLHPDHCGKGAGGLLLERLLAEGKQRDIAVVLASISSLNEGSIRFHLKHGFVECGRFPQVGRKLGRLFDVVWMQKTL